MAAKLKKEDFKVFIMLGDGECNEGSVWEAIMSAYHYKLNNLVAIVDRNSMQNDGESKDVMDFYALDKAWEGFGWNVLNIDGHNFLEIDKAFKLNKNSDKPTVIIANTIKGKGISFMENVPSWHHGKLTENTYQQAMQELEGK